MCVEERRCGFEVGGGAGVGLSAHIGIYITSEGCTEEEAGDVTGDPCQVIKLSNHGNHTVTMVTTK